MGAAKRRSRRSKARPVNAGAGADPRRPARIYREVADGRRHWALFDAGARRTYAVRDVARHLKARERLDPPIRRALAGRTFTIREVCALVGKVDGYQIDASALVVDRLFSDERGRPIEILVGMETMETWGIWLDTPCKRLDFTHYQREAYEG